MIIRWRADLIRSQENQKNIIKKEMLYLEAKALRAQMNPHFIFNCMNSIKSLINDDKEKATTYLICFSKLIRTIFQNSDKREITLYDEIETCRLYTQLEGMRFGNKFRHVFKIDETVDLKSIMVPALILQPFIENAIWHGIVPKDAGGILAITVDSINNTIRCVIDDDGIGIDMSKQNKFKEASPMHESKGVHLTQARLDLDNLLNERNATIEIIEKKDENGNSSGTTVILSFLELTRVNHSFDINKTKLSTKAKRLLTQILI
jgi:LytS/YehU family sensor histidine kinase